MDITYISLGVQCTIPLFLKNNNLRKEAYPFDWMISNPKYIYEILVLLLLDNYNISDLVINHSFNCTLKADCINIENYTINKNGFALYNPKYNVIFPHDEYNNETIQKYIRRFKRLKSIILNDTEIIHFIYISQSSLDFGNFKINNISIIDDVYIYINKIYDLISNYRKNFKIIVFDTIQNDKTILNENIELYKLDKCNSWIELIPQVEKYISNIIPKVNIYNLDSLEFQIKKPKKFKINNYNLMLLNKLSK
jgi:hypothetical protein